MPVDRRVARGCRQIRGMRARRQYPKPASSPRGGATAEGRGRRLAVTQVRRADADEIPGHGDQPPGILAMDTGRLGCANLRIQTWTDVDLGEPSLMKQHAAVVSAPW